MFSQDHCFLMNPIEAPIQSQAPGAIQSVMLAGSRMAVVVLVVFMGPFAWLLRDGLGPDSITSAGWDALNRMFWCFYWGPATIVALLIFVAARVWQGRVNGSRINGPRTQA